MSIISNLSSNERAFFESLPLDKAETAHMFFACLVRYIPLDSPDSRTTVHRLCTNFQNVQSTEKEKEAWKPLLGSLMSYLQNSEPCPSALMGRVRELSQLTQSVLNNQ